MDPKEFDPLRAETVSSSGGFGNSHRSWRGRWSALAWPWRVLCAVVLLLFAIWLILFITKGRFLKHPVERIATSMLGRQVKVAGDFQLYFAPISIKFRAVDMTIANTAWAGKTPFFTAKALDMRVASIPLIWGRRTIKQLTLDRGAIDLQWTRDHSANTWTFGTSKAPPKPLELPDIRRAAILGSKVHYADPRMTLIADIDVNRINADETRIAEAVGFSGHGSMRQQPFTLEGKILSPNETLAGGRNRISVAARSGSTFFDVSGTLPGPTQLEGSDLQVAARGPNLSRLFDFLGIAVPETPSYKLHSALTYQNSEWRFTKLGGRYGQSDLAGNMTISTVENRPLIAANLKTDKLHMIDIAPFVGYRPDLIEQQGAKALISTEGGVPRILPDAPLRVDSIRRFDAKIRYDVRTVVGKNIPISNIGLGLALDHGKLTLSPLTFLMSGGRFASDIVIDARGAPVKTDYDIRLSPTPMGKLLSRWGVAESGTTGTIRARVKMTGTGDTVRDSLASSNGRIAVVMPKGTMWARNIQLSELDVGVFIQKMFEKKLTQPVEINCGLIAFTVRDGIAAADPILIDTTKNVIAGRGSFSFKDESLNLGLRADGKKFSLFSGQSPVGLAGHFAAPAIKPISPELLTRAGAGVALGALLTPVGSILAFVDVGDAKSAACGPVLSGAKATAQRTTKGEVRKDVGQGKASK
jgi:uncharacterized protein involved in outer membrane biogenesis